MSLYVVTLPQGMVLTKSYTAHWWDVTFCRVFDVVNQDPYIQLIGDRPSRLVFYMQRVQHYQEGKSHRLEIVIFEQLNLLKCRQKNRQIARSSGTESPAGNSAAVACGCLLFEKNFEEIGAVLSFAILKAGMVVGSRSFRMLSKGCWKGNKRFGVLTNAVPHSS